MRLTLPAVLAALVLTACGSDDSSSNQTKTVTVVQTPAAPTPTPTPTPRPEPRLEGSFRVTGKVLKLEGIAGYVGQRFRRTWRFRPDCDTGPCSVELRRTFGHGGTISVRLRQDGRRYQGRKAFTGSFTCAATGLEVDNGIRNASTVRLQVRKARMIDGELRATRIAARMTIRGRQRRTGNCPDVPLGPTLEVNSYTGGLAD